VSSRGRRLSAGLALPACLVLVAVASLLLAVAAESSLLQMRMTLRWQEQIAVQQALRALLDAASVDPDAVTGSSECLVTGSGGCDQGVFSATRSEIAWPTGARLSLRRFDLADGGRLLLAEYDARAVGGSRAIGSRRLPLSGS